MSALNRSSRVLYRIARLSRDLRAVERAVETGSPAPILKRVGRRYTGRAAGRVLNRIWH